MAKIVSSNRRSRFEIEVTKVFEAGLVLTGDEIKSLRAGRAQMQGCYVKLMRPLSQKTEIAHPVVIGLHLSQAKDPERIKSLLLSKKEIKELQVLLEQKSGAAVGELVLLKRGWAKMKIVAGTGKKQHKKRQVLKERDIARDQSRELRKR